MSGAVFCVGFKVCFSTIFIYNNVLGNKKIKKNLKAYIFCFKLHGNSLDIIIILIKWVQSRVVISSFDVFSIAFFFSLLKNNKYYSIYFSTKNKHYLLQECHRFIRK